MGIVFNFINQSPAMFTFFIASHFFFFFTMTTPRILSSYVFHMLFLNCTVEIPKATTCIEPT